MATTNEPISSTFAAIAAYAIATGQVPIKGKLWHVKLDEHWEFIVNGTDEAQETGPFGQSQTSVKLDPFFCYVEFNGWPAGLFSPHGGSFAAGELANVEAFQRALRSASLPPPTTMKN
jgi:hypothetical protein